MSKTNDRALDILERAGWTAGQQFVAVLLANGAARPVVDIPWEFAMSTSAGAAVVSVATTLVQYLTNLTDKPFWIDLGIRLLKTFLASMLGSVGAGVLDVVAFDWSRALDLALVAALGALAKGLLAREPDFASATGRPSPSTLPNATYRRAVA
ncbi:holin [Nocardioides sp. MH1]|uniref:holin n=1 Tax=Nocardioides sp. MH1 TaxID=3242490 RepID=UPI00352245CB